MQTRSGDADIFYTTLGDGPDIVLLHAFPANHEMWFPVAKSLSTRYCVTLMDLRGHGLSSAGDGPATMQKHAADVAAVDASIELICPGRSQQYRFSYTHSPPVQ